MLMIFCNSIMTASAKYHTHCNAFYKQQLYESCLKFSLIKPPFLWTREEGLGKLLLKACSDVRNLYAPMRLLELHDTTTGKWYYRKNASQGNWICYWSSLEDLHVNFWKNASQGNWICYWSSLEDIQLHVHVQYWPKKVHILHCKTM